MFMAGKAPPSGMTEKQDVVPQTKVKGFFWNKLPNNKIEGTIWTSLGEGEEAGIDTSFLEAAFSAKASSRPKSVTIKKETTAPKKVSLLDGKRIQNVGIVIGRIRLSKEQMKEAIIQLDPNFVTGEMIDKLLGLVPTSDEVDALTSYSGDLELLGNVEKLLLTLSTIPRLQQRLSCVQITETFGSACEGLFNRIEMLSNATSEVRYSHGFQSALRTVLSMGNFLNGGTSRGQAYGFKLETLNKLTAFKVTPKPSNSEEEEEEEAVSSTPQRKIRGTLMHFVAQHLLERSPDDAAFFILWENVKEASTTPLSQLEAELNNMRNQRARVEREVKEGMKAVSDPVAVQVFKERMEPFLEESAILLENVTSAYEAMRSSLKELVEMYGEGAKLGTPEEDSSIMDFFGMLDQFARGFDQAVQDLEKWKIQDEKERQRKERERLAQEERKKRQEEKEEGEEGEGEEGSSSRNAKRRPTRGGNKKSNKENLFGTFKNAQLAETDAIVAQFKQRMAIQRDAFAPEEEEDEDDDDFDDWS